ncbi:MAG: FAD-binding oxidoreductase [Bacteroidetes bacterium]|nr:FAD-binding oxidoreductase [Bacteroidota bacterium]
MISFWEKKAFFDNPEFVVVGSGIVGMTAAYFLRQKNPDSKIIVVDGAPFSNAASFKNAGFACFGSAGELFSDYKSAGKESSLITLKKRFDGLSALNDLIDFKKIDYQKCGSWEMFDLENKGAFEQTNHFLEEINTDLNFLLNEKDTFRVDHRVKDQFNFSGLPFAIHNRLEGSLDVAKLNLELIQLLAVNHIPILRNLPVIKFQECDTHVTVSTALVDFNCKKLILATNGFSKTILPELEIKPARAQVLITKPIPNLKVKGTFHMNNGFDYFRNVDDRILIGGGRNINLKGEETDQFELTDEIQNHLEGLLKNNILPHKKFEIEHRWSGIMGVGETKSPLLGNYSKNISYGIRLGGMGVAIGTLVGKELAEIQN